MKYFKNGLLLVVFFMLATLVLPQQAQAVTLFSSRAAWDSAVSSYAAVSSLDAIANTTLISSFALPSGITASFGSPLTVASIGSGWATWSGTYSGKVLSPGTATSTIGTFSSPVFGFGLEMEPDVFSDYTMTLLLNDGSSLTQTVNGDAGAKFFGWTGGSISSMTLSSNGAFAFGNMVEAGRVAATPEPMSLSLLGMGLLGLIGFGRKKK